MSPMIHRHTKVSWDECRFQTSGLKGSQSFTAILNGLYCIVLYCIVLPMMLIIYVLCIAECIIYQTAIHELEQSPLYAV